MRLADHGDGGDVIVVEPAVGDRLPMPELALSGGGHMRFAREKRAMAGVARTCL